MDEIVQTSAGAGTALSLLLFAFAGQAAGKRVAAFRRHQDCGPHPNRPASPTG